MSYFHTFSRRNMTAQLGWIRFKFGSKYIPDGIMVPEVLAVPDWWDEELAVWHLDEVDEDADAESKWDYKMNELSKMYIFEIPYQFIFVRKYLLPNEVFINEFGDTPPVLWPLDTRWGFGMAAWLELCIPLVDTKRGILHPAGLHPPTSF